MTFNNLNFSEMRNDSVNIQCKHYQESKDHLGVKVTTTGYPDVAVQKKTPKNPFPLTQRHVLAHVSTNVSGVRLKH